MKIKEVGFTENGIDKTGILVTFDDGSKLLVCAKVKLPPEDELTPENIQTYDLKTGEKGFRQSILGEAFRLSEASSAFQALRRIEALVSRI